MAVFAPMQGEYEIEYFVKTQKILKPCDFVEVTKKDGTCQIVRIEDEPAKIENGYFWYSFERITNLCEDPKFWKEFVYFLKTTTDSAKFDKRLKEYTKYHFQNSTPKEFYNSIKHAIKNNYYKHKIFISKQNRNW